MIMNRTIGPAAWRLPQLPLDTLLQQGEAAIEAALAEDHADGDPTRGIVGEVEISAIVVAKQPGILAGLPVAERVFHRLEAAIRFDRCAEDGQPVSPGDIIARVKGPAGAILSAERTALNFLQRMSGIATATAAFVRQIATTPAILRDTRKTAPGLRSLDKYAVRIGGGLNHRATLADLAMIKDTHIAAAGSIRSAVEAVRNHAPTLPLEVEIRTLAELDELLSITPLPERILLDNFPASTLRGAVARVAGRATTEASGGITLDTVRPVAETGVDELSVGALTHSAAALDLSLTVESPSRCSQPSLEEEVAALRWRLGDRVVVLAHHYTRDEVVEQADIVGDSLALARSATEENAEWIVFCGVRFMGETAAVLCRPNQQVVMPRPDAGCYLADCANIDAIEAAWKTLDATLGTTGIVPVTYVNSSIELKAFCGRNGGIVCTSANAVAALRWALDRSDRAFFFPDQHLGANASASLGLSTADRILWSPMASEEALRRARVILWPGACDVHQRFRSTDVDAIRTAHPETMIVVHPECAEDTVKHADDGGSTGQIIRAVASSTRCSMVAIGTEARLIHRLQKQHPDKRIVPLGDVPSYCKTMSLTTLADLRDTLRDLEEGKPGRRRISVSPACAAEARSALERMLSI